MNFDLTNVAGWIVSVGVATIFALREKAHARRRKADRRVVEGRANLGVREPEPGTAVTVSRQDVHDECLRRGYNLPQSQFLADRATALGSLDAAERELHNPKGN